MSDAFAMPDTLRSHRPLLLALEAIGWLHMAGKANPKFLRSQGRQNIDYKYEEWYGLERPIFPWNDRLHWVMDQFPLDSQAWPPCLTDFISKHSGKNKGFLGLLQAAHGITSGVEKNIPDATSEYLKQDITHLWLSSAFGNPERNLLVNPPELLSDSGWNDLIEEIKKLLEELEVLGNPSPPHTRDDLEGWWNWREGAIGEEGWLRKAFSTTLAETRLPNNDVTLFDQSYVTAALFKSAAAGALLEGKSFDWDKDDLKQRTQWRLLTIGISSDYYEGRSVQIGDWVGAKSAIDEFFIKARKLVEVELAVGSLLYADDEVLVFSFPGEQVGTTGSSLQIDDWRGWITAELDHFACEANFETPPYCAISERPSRSLVGMTKEIRKAKGTLATPLHQNWNIPQPGTGEGHICPVCMVRRNENKNDKQKACGPCTKRRQDRRVRWLAGNDTSDTIWISEVADGNDRLALLTMSLDIEPWLDGSRLDSLRSQAIGEWSHNSSLKQNPIKKDTPYSSLLCYTTKQLGGKFNPTDNVFNKLHAGYSESTSWEDFYEKIVEDRSDAPKWADLTLDKRAEWLTHQFFRKLASPGRVYRFQRQSMEFFEGLLNRFRELSSADENRWRTRRLLLKPQQRDPRWKNGDPYSGHFRGGPIDLLWNRKEKEDEGYFITISNLGRLLQEDEEAAVLSGASIKLKDDNNQPAGTLTIENAIELSHTVGHLGCYFPAIPLGLSPGRFRVLVPLNAASACVDAAREAWESQYARVWDRLPLRVGVVAFPRKTPFQAIIEATRNVEVDLEKTPADPHWNVVEASIEDERVNINLSQAESDFEPELWSVPITLPDGRMDAFYPYVEMDHAEVLFPLDFREPHDRHVYRHMKDLKRGDAILICPSRIATLFLDDTGNRFEPNECRSLKQWARMCELWAVLNRAPSQTALRGAWSEVLEKRDVWRGPDGSWLPGGQEAWLDFVESIFRVRLKLNESDLKRVVCAAKDGILEWCLEWNLHVLKEKVSGGMP
ncbi:MAG: CRISPR-associated protein Csx11 [Rectinema sp.]